MEENKTNSGQNLGVAALITGIITFVLAVIPCVGILAIIPGIIAVVLAAVGLSQATRTNSPRGVIVAGLVIGAVALMIAFSQIFFIGRMARNNHGWNSDFRSAIEEVKRDIKKDFEKGNVNIKIESNGESIEIKADGSKEGRLKQLEDLESGKKEANDTTKKSK